MKKYSGEKSQDSEYVVVRSECVGDTDNDHGPLTQQEDWFTAELVRQSSEDHSTKHDADDEYCLCEVLEICTITDQVPLQIQNRISQLNDLMRMNL